MRVILLRPSTEPLRKSLTPKALLESYGATPRIPRSRLVHVNIIRAWRVKWHAPGLGRPGTHSAQAESHDGSRIVPPRWSHFTHRGFRLSTSLDASGPQRMTNGASGSAR